MGNSGNKNGGWRRSHPLQEATRLPFVTWSNYLRKKEGFKCWSVLSDQRVFIGLAGAPAEAVKPYEAKVEWLSWFQLSEEGRSGFCDWMGCKLKPLNFSFDWRVYQIIRLLFCTSRWRSINPWGRCPLGENHANSSPFFARNNHLLFRAKTALQS